MLHVESTSQNPDLIFLEHPIVDAPLGAALVAMEYWQLSIHAKAGCLAVPVNVPYWQMVQHLRLNLYPIMPVQCQLVMNPLASSAGFDAFAERQ